MMKEQIVYKQVNELKNNPKNPRLNDDAVESVAKSIEKYGFRNPLIIDENNIVWCGNTRLKAAKKLGLKEAPCICVKDLTEKQMAEYALLDNKTNESAEWDYEKLEEILPELDFGDFDFDWGVGDLEEEKEVKEDDFDVDANIPEEPKAKLGDIYQLGNHRLMCGDSTKEEYVEKLMDGKLADLLFTDPPYNVSMENKSKEILKSENYSHIENDDLPLEEFEEFLGNVFVNANNSLKDDASYYVFSCQGGDNEMMMMMMMRQSGIKCRHQIIWVKDAPVFSMGRLDYDYKHEPILYGWKKKHNFYRKGEQDKSVWEFKRTANKLHPTMKPIELIANALQNSTKQNDLVLDLFGGSGSTLIACEQLNRKCYMMEIDPHYCDVIIDRWEQFTGQKAIKVKV